MMEATTTKNRFLLGPAIESHTASKPSDTDSMKRRKICIWVNQGEIY
jgi:hypothetical protein